MSINVTVSGNPVRINRGKMVTTQDLSKNEFQKRRLMRFEQVRQQSKDIAEEIRNRIKREKTKCQSKAEKEGEVQLKKWQARKLLELQDQYQEALEDIGLGHRQAIQEQKDEELEVEHQVINDKIASERGRKAAERLQIDKNEGNLKKAAPMQRKKLTRDIENVRSATIISSTNTNSTRKKKQRLDLPDSDSENVMPPLINLLSDSVSESEKIMKTSKGQQTSSSAFLADKAAQTTPQDPTAEENNLELPLDTRISDRIRRRANLNADIDYCDIIRDKMCSKEILCNCCKCHLANEPNVEQLNEKSEKPKRSMPGKINKTITPQVSEPKEKPFASGKLPRKPKITLRSSTRTNFSSEKHPRKYYEHSNRFTGKYIPKIGKIDFIGDDNLIVDSEALSEDEYRKQMGQHDIEAQLRGQAAAEKERIQKEYQDLLRKLPALQKQERVLEIGLDKEKYHMSRDRLEELERRRQNRLDNAYEELFVRQKPTVVTLPRQQPQDFGPQSSNLATWDTDYNPPHDKTDELNKMLDNLKQQKKQLINEIESTLSQKSAKKTKSTEHSVDKNHRKRKIISPTSSRTKSNKKARKKVLVLQNCSTQTTPKSEHSAATSPVPSNILLNEDATSCTCQKESSNQDDMCEIVIKIKEDEKPEVIINPSLSEKTVTVVADHSEAPKEVKIDPVPEQKIKQPDKRLKKREKTSSWGESFSRTASSHSTTSTSYFEPPKPLDDTTKSVDSTSSTRKLDPRLLVYIKKLLNMSRANIDDLAVSGSDVSTPSASVINTSANNPLQQLRNVMKYFNLDSTELQKQLSYISDANSVHHNSSRSATIASSTATDAEKSIQLTPGVEADDVGESGQKLIQYADIAASCSKKISNLTAMIEKVRAEKKQILLSPPTSGEDLTKTSYMKLPDKNEESVSSSSSGQDELDQQLLGIDYKYAEHLKQLTPEARQIEREKTDQDLLNRLKTLLEESPVIQTSVNIESPLFLDIPKLPRLEIEKKKKRPPPSKGLRAIPGNNHTVAPHELSTIVEADSQISTKLESPTKLKTSLSSSSSLPDIITETNKNVVHSTATSTDVSEIETMETMLSSIGMDWAIPTLRKTREALALTSSSSSSKDVSLRDFLSKISTSDSISNDSQGMSLIQVDNRKTSTPIAERRDERVHQPQFHTDSDLSSVKDQSSGTKSVDEGSLSKTG